VKVTEHARGRSVERQRRSKRIGKTVDAAMRTGLVLPYENRPGTVMVVAKDGRRWLVDEIQREVITVLPRMFYVSAK